jgi:regulatory protein
MGKVTAIRAGKRQHQRVNLFLDGHFALSLGTETVVKENLRVGQELSQDQIEALVRLDGRQRCLEAALRYLDYRPRSEAELRERLSGRGFDDDSIETVLKRLKQQALVNDTAFARFWRDNRQSFRPRSRWLTTRELRQKGVASDIIEQVVATIDDEDSAYRAATTKLHRMPPTDYQDFRRRLGDYLKRQGFSYEVINHTIRQMWHEQEQERNTT